MWRLIRPDAIAILRDERAVRSLNRYFDVFQERKKAKFLVSKKLEVDFKEEAPIEELWREHDEAMDRHRELEKKIDEGEVEFDSIPTPHKSYLDLKIEIASRMLQHCTLCERRCGVNRMKGELGVCSCGIDVRVSSMFTHTGEEAVLVPSYTVFTMGCNLYCVHCQNWTISRWYEAGEVWEVGDLARAIERARTAGNRNANLVGGEPTPWLPQWLRVFKQVKSNIPIVWNSNTWYSEETAKLLVGFADVYLNDFKYGNNDCGERISNAPRYWDVCTRNMLIAKEHGELLIRVLVLPGHVECCTRKIATWIAENLGSDVRTNLMFQYRPEFEYHRVPGLERRLTREEREKVKEIAREAGLTNVEPWQE
jgi:putative pyruvate formate lyase activating enzyme